MTPVDIRNLISRGRVDEAVKGLQAWANDSGDSNSQNHAIQLAAQWNNLKSKEITGVISNSEAGITRAKIVNAILTLVKDDGSITSTPVQIPDTEPAPVVTIPTTKPAPPPSNPPNNNAKDAKNRFPVYVGLGLLLLIVGLLVYIPCPSSSQYQLFHTIIALAAGGIGAMLPGFLSYKPSPMLTGGGAVALFLLVFLVRPEQSMAEGRCANEGAPFTMTLALQANKPNSDYPTYDGTVNKIQLWTGNEYRTGDVNANLVVDFKNMPNVLRGEFSELRLLKPETSPWKLAMDSVRVNPSGQKIQLIPSGLLSRVWGRVRDNNSAPVSGAIITFRTFADTTGTNGRFEFVVPIDQQRSPYPVEIVAPGYQTREMDAYSHTDLNVVLEEK